MRFRYPDDPMRVSVDALREMDDMPPGTWLAQPKSDDWRRPAYLVGGRWTFASKYGGARAAIQPPREVVAELDLLGLPDNTAIDMGWMGRRCRDALRGRNYFVLFDLLYLDDQWQGQEPFRARYDTLRSLVGEGSENVSVAELRDRGLVEWFDEQKEDPLSEGLVLRRADSRLIGDFRGKKKNPHWAKVKYRDIKEPTKF